ncbi:hypothetical protein KSS87_001457, partial [Heliosperma pusillum]
FESCHSGHSKTTFHCITKSISSTTTTTTSDKAQPASTSPLTALLPAQKVGKKSRREREMRSDSEKNTLLPVTDPPLKGDDKLFKGSAMSQRGAYAALSYMSCAVLLVMFNKAALSSYHFPSANVITLFQMTSSCSFLYAMRRWKVISFTAAEASSAIDNPVTLVPLKTLLYTLPLAFAYLMYMTMFNVSPSKLVTMESVRGVNVPMYTTLRRTTVVFTMVIEYFLAKQKYSSPIVGSVGLIVLGALVAGSRDLSFDAYGYGVVFLANITTAIYLATIARIGFLCGPILLFWTYVRGDLEMMVNFPDLRSPGFLVVLLFSCVLAFFLNYSIFLNTTLNSALTQTICGNLKDFVTIGLGWAIFGGLPFDLLNVIGQLLGFLGSGLYAYYKLVGK